MCMEDDGKWYGKKASLYLSYDHHRIHLKPYLWSLTRENEEKADQFEIAGELTLLSRMFLFSNTTVRN